MTRDQQKWEQSAKYTESIEGYCPALQFTKGFTNDRWVLLVYQTKAECLSSLIFVNLPSHSFIMPSNSKQGQT